MLMWWSSTTLPIPVDLGCGEASFAWYLSPLRGIMGALTQLALVNSDPIHAPPLTGSGHQDAVLESCSQVWHTGERTHEVHWNMRIAAIQRAKRLSKYPVFSSWQRRERWWLLTRQALRTSQLWVLDVSAGDKQHTLQEGLAFTMDSTNSSY